MKNYENLGFFDFEDFIEELTDEQLFTVNGGGCGGGAPSGGHGPTGGGSCGGGYNPTYSPSPSIPSYSCNGGYTYTSPETVFKRIIKSIADNWKKQYNYVTGYQCDNWVEEVLDYAGVKSSKYLKAGKANAKTVQNHIDALLSKGKKGVDYTMLLPDKKGVYVVFMDNGKRNGVAVGEHCALLVVENGVKTIYHNSSGNGGKKVYQTNSKGQQYLAYYDQGVGSETVVSYDNGKTLSGWCYSTYYYQEVKNY